MCAYIRITFDPLIIYFTYEKECSAETISWNIRDDRNGAAAWSYRRSSSTLLILLVSRIFVVIIFNYDETRWLEKIVEFALKILLWRIISLSEYRHFRSPRCTRQCTCIRRSYIFVTEGSNKARSCNEFALPLFIFSFVSSRDVPAIFHLSPGRSTLFIGRSPWKYASVHVRNVASKWQKEPESLLQIWVHLCAHTYRAARLHLWIAVGIREVVLFRRCFNLAAAVKEFWAFIV